ncbi:hypothetical protein [Catelliglobosispora koreensis]|uniref:hypothetical protein n=1 Tax=Catelliglobosispora koreensis TaxID=129052 RepID=UPI0003687BC5|nr:hypothetical protein [Catelliglobosispora koreensis]
MRHRWGSQRLTYLSFALILMWTVYLTVLISSQPPRGADDPGALAVRFEEAVSARDNAEIKRLVFEADMETQSVDRLVSDARCGDRMRASDGHIAVYRADGSLCGRLAIAEHNGRWFIDPWADPLLLGR